MAALTSIALATSIAGTGIAAYACTEIISGGAGSDGALRCYATAGRVDGRHQVLPGQRDMAFELPCNSVAAAPIRPALRA